MGYITEDILKGI